MSKRSLGVVLAAVACTAVVGAAFYFGSKGFFLSPKSPRADSDPPQQTPLDDEAPPDASLYRPAPVSLAPASAFLFTGKSPRQFGAARDALQRRRAAVLRGRVVAAGGQPLAGVEVGAPSQPEVGRTLTDADGAFDLAVNGGGWVIVSYEKPGWLPVRRQAAVPWNNYVWLPEVALIPVGGRIGVLDLPASEAPAPLQGEQVKDGDGVRRPVFLAPPDFGARVIFADGDKPLGRLTLSAAEYSIGPLGEAALPAPLPPGAGCAYAFQLDADEAKEPGAREVRFSKPLIHYVENFLQVPVGTVLPVARCDVDRCVWVPGPAGRVVRVLGVKDGLAELDLDGKGEPAAAAALAKLGVDGPERRRLAGLDAKDQTLWRLPLTGLGAWAVLPAPRLPLGAVAPPWGLVTVPADNPSAPPPPPAVETVEAPGTHLHLCYSSDRASGCKPLYTLEVALGGGEVPAQLWRIDLEILVAGQRHFQSFPLLPADHAYPKPHVFTWDGLDAYGRPVQGRRAAVVRIGYVYYPVRPARGECVLWREQRILLGDWDARAQALGGWTLNVHHAYDPIGRVLLLGGGKRIEGLRQPPIVTTVAGGTGVLTYNDDDQPATSANLSQPRGLTVGPDGSLYIADTGQHRVRRVGPDGLISTVAGTGRKGYDGDNRPGAETPLNAPTGLAFGPDGSLYIADDGNDRVRRLRPDGALTAFAGRGGKFEYGGDGGPAVSAQLSILRGLAVGPAGDLYVAQNSFYQCVRRIAPDGVVTRIVGGPAGKADLHTASDVAAGPDGVLYVADGDGNRVWRVGTDGAASVFAGTGKAGFSGDGGIAANADLNTPSGLAMGPDGSVYVADAGNQRVRRVDPNGVIATVVGKGKADSARETGDDGPAIRAALRLSERTEPGLGRLCGLAVGPEGELYVADVGHSSVRRVAPPFGGISDSEILLNSEDGSELYVFDGVGRHLQTLNATTGTVIYRFVYDATWRLKEVHDGADAATRIERDTAGRPKALVAPDGGRTTLKTGEDGRLSRMTFPAGEAVEMEYDSGGLLTSFKNTTGNVTRFRYDGSGMLVKE